MKQRDGNGQCILEAFLELGRLMLMALLAALLAACSDALPALADTPTLHPALADTPTLHPTLADTPPPRPLLANTPPLHPAMTKNSPPRPALAVVSVRGFEPASSAACRPVRNIPTRFQTRVRPGGQTR